MLTQNSNNESLAGIIYIFKRLITEKNDLVGDYDLVPIAEAAPDPSPFCLKTEEKQTHQPFIVTVPAWYHSLL